MEAYKLFKLRKDGTLGPLFINRRQRIAVDEWLYAESHPTKGYTPRTGWHCTLEKKAPHLSEKGRVWAKVEVLDYTFYERPESQGGIWLLANKMKVLEVLT